MRSAAVSPLLLLAACAADGAEAVYIKDFVERSPLLACAAADMGTPPASVVRLRAVGDSLLAAIADGDREILLLDRDLVVRARVRWENDGPTALKEPVDVELVGDTLLAVLDRGRARLSFLDLQGLPRGSLPLGFAPNRMLRDGDGWLVTAVPLAPTQGEVLHRVSGEAVQGMGVAPAHEAAPQLKALANSTVLERVGGGRLIVAHQYLLPRAYLLDVPPGGGRPAAVQLVATPLPEGVRDAVGFRPEPPFNDEGMRRILTPVLEAAPDPAGGGILYLTRTGRKSGETWEKGLVRVDADMTYRASWIFPANVGPFAYLASRNEVIAVAEDERWYRCSLGPGGGT